MPQRVLTVLVPALLTFGMCLWQIDGRQVWRDEHATWWAATLPREALLLLLSRVDAVLAPYYFLMRGTVAVLGDSPLALRLPSALAMSACAALLARLGTRLFSPLIGLYAGVVFALVPTITRYGQEARPYALVLLFVVSSALALVAARARPSLARLALYAASLVALGSLHLLALCSLLSHPILLFERDAQSGSPRLRAPLRFGAAVALALLTLSPLVYFGLQQMSDQLPSRSDVASPLAHLPRMLFTSPMVGRLLLLLSLFALWRRDQPRLFVAAWALLPVAFLYLSHPQVHMFVPRYLVFVVPAFCLLAASTLADAGRFLATRARRPLLAYVLPTCAFALLAFAGRGVQKRLRAADAPRRDYDYAGIAKLLQREGRPSDAIAFAGAGHCGDWARMAMAYEGRARPALQLRDVFVDKSGTELGGFNALECEEVERCLPDDVERLWLVTCAEPEQPLAHMARAKSQLLSGAFSVAKIEVRNNLRLVLLTRRRVVVQ